MKKLLIAACFMLGFAGIASAQEAAKKAPEKKAAMTVVKKAPEAKVVKMEKAKPATTTAAGPTKADGTLDKRYKANKGKTAAPAEGPLKKDGTPDKRFKTNKKG
jgi:hypothetical protein